MKNQKKNVILVIKDNITKEAFHVYGLDYLQANDFDVKVWIISPNTIDNNKEKRIWDKTVDSGFIVYIRSFHKYKKMVKETTENCVFYVHHSIPSGLLYPICFYKKTYFVLGIRELLAGPKIIQYPNCRNDKNGIVERMNKIAYEGFAKYLRRNLQSVVITEKNRRIIGDGKYIVDTWRPRTVFVANNESIVEMIDLYPHWKNCNFSLVNSRQYDYYLEEEKKNNPLKEEIVLFAVSGLGFSNIDITPQMRKFERIYSPEANDKYKKDLEILLDKLESYYKLPVVIAGHPRADYGSYSFGGREIVYGKTCELTKKCRVFIINKSISIDFPILYDKEILVYYCDAIKEGLSWKIQGEPMLNELGIKALNLDNQNDMEKPWKYAQKINPSKRKHFIDKYISRADNVDRRTFPEIFEEQLDVL